MDYHFDETNFPLLESRKPHKVRHELSWIITTLSHLNPRNLPQITIQLPDAFIDAAKVTKSYSSETSCTRFLSKTGIDYTDTYSLVMDAITF